MTEITNSSRTTRLPHEQLATSGFTLLTVSRPGYDSTPVTVGRSAQEAADALVALLDELEIETVSVIGISAGGPTALALAKRHPARVRSVLLEAAITLPWDEAVKRPARLLFGRHLIWFGRSADRVRDKRLSFLRGTVEEQVS